MEEGILSKKVREKLKKLEIDPEALEWLIEDLVEAGELESLLKIVIAKNKLERDEPLSEKEVKMLKGRTEAHSVLVGMSWKAGYGASLPRESGLTKEEFEAALARLGIKKHFEKRIEESEGKPESKKKKTKRRPV